MAKFPISLGQKMNGGLAVPYTEPAKHEPDLYFPTLHLDHVEGLELPGEGTITLRYRTCREATETAKDGDKTKSFALDIVEVVSAEGSPVDDEESASDALDKLRKETEAE